MAAFSDKSATEMLNDLIFELEANNFFDEKGDVRGQPPTPRPVQLARMAVPLGTIPFPEPTYSGQARCVHGGRMGG